MAVAFSRVRDPCRARTRRCVTKGRTIDGVDGRSPHPESPAEGLLVNVRMVNCVGRWAISLTRRVAQDTPVGAIDYGECCRWSVGTLVSPLVCILQPWAACLSPTPMPKPLPTVAAHRRRSHFTGFWLNIWRPSSSEHALLIDSYPDTSEQSTPVPSTLTGSNCGTCKPLRQPLINACFDYSLTLHW